MPITEDTKKKIIEEIKKTSNEEKVKCIGMYKLLTQIYDAEEEYDKKKNSQDFNTHNKQKALFHSALDIYKGHTPFAKAAVPNLDEFFTAEEQAQPDFEKTTSTPNASVWLTLLQKIQSVNALITDEDKAILQSLEHVEIFKNENSTDFRVEFTFGKNEYFTNDVIKVEVLTDEGDDSGEIIKEVKSTEIIWNAGKDVRHAEVTKKAKSKKGKKTAPKTVLEKKESFFWIFSHHLRPEEDHVHDEEEEEEPDEFSHENLFFQAADTLTSFERDIYQFAIPAMFGLEVDAFKFIGDFGGENEEEQSGNTQVKGNENVAKPECKQQ